MDKRKLKPPAATDTALGMNDNGSQIEFDQFNFPTFYAGQIVICVDGKPHTGFNKGEKYTVSSYEHKMNPVNGKWFWYIGIVGYHEWLRPSIFAPIIPPIELVTFEKITTDIPITAN